MHRSTLLSSCCCGEEPEWLIRCLRRSREKYAKYLPQTLSFQSIISLLKNYI